MNRKKNYTRNYTREELNVRHNQITAIIVWALVLVAVIVRWAVGV